MDKCEYCGQLAPRGHFLCAECEGRDRRVALLGMLPARLHNRLLWVRWQVAAGLINEGDERVDAFHRRAAA